MSSGPSAVDVVLCRHGETSWNETGKLQGHTDVPLNDKGKKQAQLAGEYLAKKLDEDGDFAAFVSSDLDRAAETGRIIVEELRKSSDSQALPLTLDARLRETCLGPHWQGRSWQEIEEDPAWAQAATNFRKDADFPAPGEGGESFRKRFARVVAGLHGAAFRGLLARTSGDREAAIASTVPRVLLVSHGGALDDVARLVKRVSFGHGTGVPKANAALHVVRFSPDWKKIRALVASGEESRDEDGDTAPLSLADCERAIFKAFEETEAAKALEPGDAAVALGSWELVRWGIKEHLTAEEGMLTGSVHRTSTMTGGAAAAVVAEGDIIPAGAEEQVTSMVTPKP